MACRFHDGDGSLRLSLPGPEGAGAGSGGQPADFTDDVWLFGSSAGGVFTVVRDGASADMDGHAAQVSEGEMWNLVDYVRSLGSAAGAR